MLVWNVLHAAHWKCRTQKIAKNSPSGHHHTTLSAISSQRRHISTIGKRLVKQQCLPHMSSQYGELWPTSGCDLLASLGHLSKFQWVSHLGFFTAATSLTGGQQNFAQSLAISWAATLYIHFWGLLPPNRILQDAKLTLRPSLAFSYIGSVMALQQRASAKLRHGTKNGITELLPRAPPIFGWAAITLGIGPHSSYC